ncbi:hypothetical protein [Methylohalobius crimeensis]|nr:hypothetical protein [Methylohalobius crimeensis]
MTADQVVQRMNGACISAQGFVLENYVISTADRPDLESASRGSVLPIAIH